MMVAVQDYHALVADRMREDELFELIRGEMNARGLLFYHTYNSRRSNPGFPDLVVVGPRGILYRELKRQKKNPEPAQVVWIERLRLVGQDVDTWRPSDWFSERIHRELQQIAGGPR